jgi:hypothetical protein
MSVEHPRSGRVPKMAVELTALLVLTNGGERRRLSGRIAVVRPEAGGASGITLLHALAVGGLRPIQRSHPGKRTNLAIIGVVRCKFCSV